MIDITERQIAEKKTDLIKAELSSSGVDYYLCETPYTVSIQIKKKLIKDNSSKSQILDNLTPSKPTENIPSLASSPLLNASSPAFSRHTKASGDDSGISNGCVSCESATKVNELKKLEDIITSKNSIIKQLEHKLKLSEEENGKIKVEIKTKNDQLKQKNKHIEKFKSDLENEKEERETNNQNYSNKINNLEKKILNLNESLKEKNEIIKEEKKKLKSAQTKKKSKDQSTQTENLNDDKTATSSTQTYTEKKDVGISPNFTKLFIQGEPFHHVTCFCVCHEGNGGRCEVQLFKLTCDPEVALDSLYYREEYDDWVDDKPYDDSSEELDSWSVDKKQGIEADENSTEVNFS